MRYRCKCGQAYLTGAVEWDFLSERERRNRVRQSGLAVVGVAPLVGFVFLLRSAMLHRSITLFIVCAAVIIPVIFWCTLFVVDPIREAFDVAASLWRTRVARRNDGANC
jgi:hypothetical protein